MQNARKRAGKRVAESRKKQGFSEEKAAPLMGAAELSYNLPPTQSEFKRFERIWRKTPEGKRRGKGSQVERLAAYFEAFLSIAFKRIERLASGTLSERQREHEKKQLIKDLQLCREIDAFHVRKQLSQKVP